MEILRIDRAAEMLSGFGMEGIVNFVDIVVESLSGVRCNAGINRYMLSPVENFHEWSKDDWCKWIRNKMEFYRETSDTWKILSVSCASTEYNIGIESTKLERFDRLVISNYPIKECYLTLDESEKIRGILDVVKLAEAVQEDRLTKVESNLPKFLRKRPGYNPDRVYQSPRAKFLF